MEDRKSTDFGPLALLLTAGLTDSFIRPFGQTIRGCSAQPFVLASCLLFPLFWLLMSLYCRAASGTKRPWLFNGLLTGVLLLSAAMEIMQCQRFYAYVLGPHLPLFWFLLLTLAVTAYSRTMSKGALARTAQMVLLLWGFSLVLMVIAVMGLMRVENLECQPLNWPGLKDGLALRAMLLPEYLLLPVLVDRCKQKSTARHAAAWMVGGLFVADVFLAIIVELVLGPHAQDQAQALYSVARLGGISVFRRLDAVHVCVWLMLYFIKISLYFESALQLLGEMSGHRPTPRLTFVLFGVSLVLFGALWRWNGSGVYWLQQGLLWVLLIAPLFWRKRGKDRCETQQDGLA